MPSNYITDQPFNKTDFTQHPLAQGEYEACTFTHCDFSNTDLSDFQFVECTFDDCNLSNIKITHTAWRDVTFKNCKMLGLHFEDANEFGLAMTFHHCNLSHSSFYQRKLKKTVFRHVILHDADFSMCDLSLALFDDCDLAGALFDNTNLSGTDFRTAFHYIIDPDNNRIKKARFSLSGVAGLLNKYDIHID